MLNILPVGRLDEFKRAPFPRLLVLSLNRAGTTLAAESLASNVITHAATIIKPRFFVDSKLGVSKFVANCDIAN